MTSKLLMAVVLIVGLGTTAHAEMVPLTNADFDQCTRWYFNNGLDYTSVYDVPVWHDLYTDGDGAYDMGVEYENAWWVPYEGYSCFISNNDGAWLGSSYVIQEGDTFTVSLAAKNWWGIITTARINLFYGNDPTTNLIGYFDQTVNGIWTLYTDSSIAATAGSVGQTLGVCIDNDNGVSYFCFDELTIDVTHANDPFLGITASPQGGILTNSVTLEAVVNEGSSIVDITNSVMYLDGAPVSAVFDRSLAPTATISYVASGLTAGVYTGKVVVVGDPVGGYTNEWTFTLGFENSVPTSPAHHWNFMDGSGRIVTDISGGADGIIIGNNFAWIAGGGLDLYGGGASGDWNGTTNGTAGSYVDLPNGILSSLTDEVTIEVTFQPDTSAMWQRVYDLGNSEGGEDVSDWGGEGVFLTAWDGDGAMIAYSTNNPASEIFQLESTTTVGERIHVVWVYDASQHITKMYHNGTLIETELAASWPISNVNDFNNYIGRSQYNDPMFDGRIYDLRIYTGIMTASEVAERYARVVLSDDDSDGLSNADESLYGTDPYNPDTDGDGQSDGDEVFMGFNPANSSSGLNFHGVIASDVYMLLFDTTTGRVFVVEAKSSLVTGEWRPFFSFSGTGSEIIVNDDHVNSNNFYRINVTMP